MTTSERRAWTSIPSRLTMSPTEVGMRTITTTEMLRAVPQGEVLSETRTTGAADAETTSPAGVDEADAEGAEAAEVAMRTDAEEATMIVAARADLTKNKRSTRKKRRRPRRSPPLSSQQ